MKRSGAIWLVAGVIAVAAVLMYFVVLPQIREGKTVDEVAKTAQEAVKDVKQTINDAGEQVQKAADSADQAKASALAKMARIGQDTKGAADEMKALFDKGAPTAEQIAAAKTKLAAALKAASELKVPVEADVAAKAAATRISAGAKAALDALDKLPADPAQAKAALADLDAKIMAALPEGAVVKPATSAADSTQKVDGASTTKTPADTAAAATPAFDILRVEKDGSTVIAGRADPGSKVEVVDGDKVIASADAEPSGDFAAVLDNPLTAGDHSIVLKATKDGKAKTSEEVATVSVPKDASGELLAMVTKPGEASKIITMPEVKDTDVASNKTATPDVTKEAKAADGATAQEAVKVKETAKADVTKTEEPAKTAAEADAKLAAAPDLPASSSDIATTPPTVSQDEAAAKTEESQTAKADMSTQPADVVPPAGQRQTAGTPEVMVSAVELEGDKIFVAGSTRPNAVVRVYADDQIVAETKADANGRFVADGTIKLAVGNHTIRADVLSGDGSKVDLRASVPFFRPEGDLAAVASADAAKDQPAIEPLANGTFDKARDEAGKALGLLQGLYANGKMPTAEELAAARSSTEIALKSLAEVHVSADVDPALADMAKTASDQARKALDKLKAMPSDVAGFKAALGDVETIVGSAVKPGPEVAVANDGKKTAVEPAKPEAVAANQTKPAGDGTAASQAVEKQETVSSNDVQVTAKVDRLTKSTDVAKSDGKLVSSAPTDLATKPADGASATATGDAKAAADQSASQKTASAEQPKVIEQAPLKQSDSSVIIRRGDTLWQISRRVYGRGVRYTTIYIANKAQIDDPDRILPGQIFTMPGKWLDNAEELHKERLLLHGHKKP